MTDYTAFKLPQETREALLRQFPPAYPEVKADHITHRVNVSDHDDLFVPGEILVTGVVDDDNGMQVLVVSVDGETHKPDGRPYHITWSFDPDRDVPPALRGGEGRAEASFNPASSAAESVRYKAKFANNLVSSAQDTPGEPYAIVPVEPPLPIQADPVLIQKIGPEKTVVVTPLPDAGGAVNEGPQSAGMRAHRPQV